MRWPGIASRTGDGQNPDLERDAKRAVSEGTVLRSVLCIIKSANQSVFNIEQCIQENNSTLMKSHIMDNKKIDDITLHELL